MPTFAMPVLAVASNGVEVTPMAVWQALLVLGTAGGGLLGFMALALKVYDMASRDAKKRQAEHDRMMRVLFGQDGGGEGPGLAAVVQAMREEIAEASDRRAEEFAELRRLLMEGDSGQG